MMKKRLPAALVALLVISVVAAGCGGGSSSSSSTSTAGDGGSPAETKSIGIGLIAPLSVLEENIEAFKDELSKQGVEAEYEEFNAQGQISNVNSIATRLEQLEPDLVYLVGTPLVEAFAQHNPGVPLLFGAMTDPTSDNVVESLEHPGGEATGTSDRVPAKLVYEVLREALPEGKKVGVIGNSAESNTVDQIEELKELSAEEGIELEERTVTNTSEVSSAIKSLEGVDALIVPNDNTVTSAINTVAQTSSQLGIPTFELAGDSMAEEGFMVGIGVNYVRMGTEAGEQAVEILGEVKAPAEIPVAVGAEKELDVGVNLTLAKELGVPIPASLQKRAKVVVGK